MNKKQRLFLALMIMWVVVILLNDNALTKSSTWYNYINLIVSILLFIYVSHKFINAKETVSNIIELEAERMAWSIKTFPEATAISSLRKLEGEVEETEIDIINGHREPLEYADMLMCLFDSAGRQDKPITPQEIFDAFEKKLKINKARTWVKNIDNTYSHVKK